MTSPLRADVPKLRLAEPRIRQILIPFDKRECINLKQAADIAGKSESTIMQGAGNRWHQDLPRSVLAMPLALELPQAPHLTARQFRSQ
jgi:hypothetical protein